MNTAIDTIWHYLNGKPKAKEWLWFVLLWCGGLFAALALAYPIKYFIKHFG